MDKIILLIISIFFVIGAVDYIIGNRLRIGEKFEQGIATMGTMFLAIAGIYSLSPIMANCLEIIFTPIAELFSIDPSLFPSMILATDMGGYIISEAIAIDSNIGMFSGILLASTLGTTISFTMPVAMSIISEEDMDSFVKGTLAGMITIPFVCFIGGIMQGINMKLLILNEAPIILIVFLIIYGMKKNYKGLINVFKIVGRAITYIGLAGLILQGINIINGYEIIPGLVPAADAALVCGKIGVVLAGAYPMISVISRLFDRQLRKIGRKIGINSVTVVGIVGALATNLLVFASMKDMNREGKILASAFSVGGAFVFGGQMGFVASKAPEMLTIFIIIKLISGFMSMAVAKIMFAREEKEEQVA